MSPAMKTEIHLQSSKTRSAKRHALIYFICGNPGLVAFYTDFFDNLHGLLDSIDCDTAYDICGRNLFGFSDEEHAPFSEANPPWDLEGQVRGIYDDVAARRHQDNESQEGKGRPYDFVVLMGHSVGAYIAVEIFHRHMKNPSSATQLNLQHGFLLFPTLTHLALSPSGRRATTLRSVPFFESSAHILARLLLTPFPESTLRWVVRTILGFSPSAAEVTAAWLKSRDGVWQALHLARAELDGICEDVWEEELWEVAAAADVNEEDDKRDEAVAATKFYMFYAKQDHWVADHVRDEFIAKREEHGGRGGRTSIAVDESGALKHAFCTRQDMSWTVSQKVAKWVEEIEECPR